MIRDFHYRDIDQCKEIINLVWDFDSRFSPIQLSTLFKTVYVTSSLSESDFAKVIEVDGKIEGFIFGKLGKGNFVKTEFSGFFGMLKLLYKFLFLRGAELKRKAHYLRIMREHDAKRSEIEPNKEVEVNLFAVDPNTQGKGYGKVLISSFVEHCRSKGAHTITLETDKECNMGFYEYFGFKIKGEFSSPLQKEYSGKSGICYVLELEL